MACSSVVCRSALCIPTYVDFVVEQHGVAIHAKLFSSFVEILHVDRRLHESVNYLVCMVALQSFQAASVALTTGSTTTRIKKNKK